MEYRKHYDALIDKARKRCLDGYTEQHHVVPRCLGGTNDPENLVALTPEEHYVAHQLLVKVHPGNEKLVYALSKMTQGRPSNKRYGWVKRKWSEVCKKRTGENNGSYGRRWYHDPETGEAGKFLDDEVPEGWFRGRSSKRCKLCSSRIPFNRVYCDEHAQSKNQSSLKCGERAFCFDITEKLIHTIDDLIWIRRFNESNQSLRKFASTSGYPYSYMSLYKKLTKYRNTQSTIKDPR